jgi:diguanylate cyclase (GGDEF) domain
MRRHQDILRAEENTAILIQVFCGRNDPQYVRQITGEIAAQLPTAHIVGATSLGEIMNGEVSGLKAVVSIAVFQKTTVSVRSFIRTAEDDFALGRRIALDLGSPATKVLMLFGAGNSIQADQVLKGITEESPQLLVAGGSAGNNPGNPAIVFSNRELIECGFIGVALAGEDLKARVYSHLGWQPIGKRMTITKAAGNRVYTINNVPAYQVYRHYLGIDKHRNFLNSVEFPLILARDGFLIARTPQDCLDDDSIVFAGDLAAGEKVRFSFGNAKLVAARIEDLGLEIHRHGAEGIFVYSCESRRGFFQTVSDIETRPLQALAPTAGFFTAGEYYHSRSINYLLNATMTVLVLAETAHARPAAGAAGNSPAEASAAGQAFCAAGDRVAGRSDGVLKALTHLINTVTDELEAANVELSYISLHDSLTGLQNRTYFDRHMKQLDHFVDDAVGIIVCDMDGLKLINDNLGHEFGDRMLKLLAHVIRSACREEDIVVRIGGDEFAVLLRGVTPAELSALCVRMKEEARKVRNVNEANILYFSVGAALREKGSVQNLNEYFIAADNAMYRYKSARRNQVLAAISQTAGRLRTRRDGRL